MKTLHFASLLGAAMISMMVITSCQQELDLEKASTAQILQRIDQKNSEVPMSGDIEFMILTPNGLAEVAYKSFTMSVGEEPVYKELTGKSFLSITSTGRYADDIISFMAFFQNLSESTPGEKLILERVSFGNFLSNDSSKAFGEYKKGDIYLKDITDSSITLRFSKVKGSNALGDYYFNGDITFDLE